MNLGIFWRLHDLISPAVQQVIRSARHAQEVMNSANKSMQRGFNDSGETVKSLQQKIDAMRGVRDSLRVGVDTREILQANIQIAKMQTQLRTLGRLGGQMQQKGGWFGAFSSAGMQRVRDSIQRVQGAFVRANAVMQRSFNGSGETVAALRQRIDALYKSRETMRIGIDTRQISQATGMITKLQGQLDKLEGKSKSSGGFLSGLMPKGLGVGLGLMGAVSMAQGALNKGMDMEVAESNFKHFVGNAQVAQDLIKQLQDYGDKYRIYRRADLINSGSALAETFGSGEVMQMTNIIGALAKGKSENFMGIMTRLQQVKGTGYLQGDELMELMNRGVFGLQEQIAKNKKINIAQFNKLKEGQKISWDDVKTALVQMTSEGGKYFGILDERMKQTKGKWDTISSMIENKITDFGKLTSGSINGILDFAIRFLQSTKPIEDALSGLGNAFRPIFSAIRDLLVHLGLINPAGDSVQQVVSLLTNVINILATAVHWAGGMLQFLVGVFQAIPFSKYIGQFLLLNLALKSIGVFSLISTITSVGTSLFSLSGIIGLVQKAWVALNSVFVLSPVGLIVTAVVALAAALYYAWNESAKFREVVMGLWGGVQEVWGVLVSWFQSIWANAVSVFNSISAAWHSLVTTISGLWNSLIAWFQQSSFGKWIIETIPKIADTFFKVIERVKEMFSAAFSFIIDKFRKVVSFFTLGLSEKAISGATMAYQKFQTGYQKGVQLQKVTEVQEIIKKTKPAASIPKTPAIPTMPSGTGTGSGAGSGSGSGGGISDTVEGAKSKSITINLNKGLIETSNIIVDSKGTGLDIERQVVEALNRVLRGADRLALE